MRGGFSGCNDTKNIGKAYRPEHSLGDQVNLDLVQSQGRNLGDVIIPPLALFLLQLEGDSTNRPLLDSLHQVGGKPSDLVAQPLCGDNGKFIADALVSVKVQREAWIVLFDQLLCTSLNSFSADFALKL